MKKGIVISAILNVFTFVLLYNIFSFIDNQWDFSKWDEETRATLCVLWGILLVSSIVFKFMIEFDRKDK